MAREVVRKRDSTNKNAATGDQVTEKVLKLNTAEDNTVREQARKQYEVAKLFKAAGLPCRVLSADIEGIRTQFKVQPTSDMSCVELTLGKDQDKNNESIFNLKENILKFPNLKIINEMEFVNRIGQKFYRVLVKIS